MSYIRKRKRNGKIYLEEVESIRVNGKVVQKHLKYIGKEVDGDTILSSSVSDISIEKVDLSRINDIRTMRAYKKIRQFIFQYRNRQRKLAHGKIQSF